MKFSLFIIATLLSVDGISAYVPQRNSITHNEAPRQIHSRRDALQHIALIIPIIATSSKSNALEQCKAKSHNCIRTTWSAPSSLSASEVVKTIQDVIKSYPQEGQAGVDCNGWAVTNDRFEEQGKLALEFKSCVGPAALAINLGQPFIDDLKFELREDKVGRIVVEVKSNSRMGSSDLFVNRKRLLFLGEKLKERGWDIPDPKYVYELQLR